jgi:glycosyltransferase involved in cell wall biosynthesis
VLGAARPTVAILMCTAEGERFIEPQLQSIAEQTHSAWHLHVSDDGSHDATLNKLVAFRDGRHRQQVDLRGGPRQGFVANFLSLVCDPGITAPYYAFCDQDDVWERDKLARALCWLENQPLGQPALYCSCTRLISESGDDLGLSPLYRKPPSFRNALVQSLAGGNTMVFNQAARELLCSAGKDVAVPYHDWWLYLLVTGVGGRIRYDQYPSVRYRQHGANHTGHSSSFPARARRAALMLLGRHRHWAELTIHALRPHRPILTPENQHVFDQFIAARAAGFLRRCSGLKQSGIYRQTMLGNLGLALAATLNRI